MTVLVLRLIIVWSALTTHRMNRLTYLQVCDRERERKWKRWQGLGEERHKCVYAFFLFCSRLQFMLWNENWSWIFTYIFLYIDSLHIHTPQVESFNLKTMDSNQRKMCLQNKDQMNEWIFYSFVQCTVNRGRCLYVIHARVFILRGGQKLCFSHLKSW